MNNPMRYTDPTGEFVPLVIAGAIGWGFFDAGLDYTFQRVIERKSFACIDWNSVMLSGGLGALTGGVGGLGRMGMKGINEFSHWIPERYINRASQSYKPWLDKERFKMFIKSEWNGNFVPDWFHGQSDFWRRPAGSVVAEKWAKPIQQIVRTPTWVWGPIGGVGVGGYEAFNDD